MTYQNYQNSRDAAWDILFDHKLSTLPIRISAVCKQSDIKILSYSQAADIIKRLGLMHSTQGNDGFAIRIGQKDYIFYDDSCPLARQRFTVAHEYGHYVNGDVSEIPTYRNREPSSKDDEIESKANVIASRILAPACVLWALDIHKAEDIAELCNISLAAAQWRLKRLNLLYKREQEFLKTYGRSCFLLSRKEREVYNQFLPFINQVKDRGQF